MANRDYGLIDFVLESPSFMGAEHLYIIGNGFDLYHGAKSLYRDFRKYLLRQDEWCAKFFELFFGPRSLMNNFDDPLDFELSTVFGKGLPFPQNTWATKYLWSDFEKHLSEFDREKVFDFLDMRLPTVDVDDDKFSYANFFAPIEFIADTVNECTFEMQYRFHRWINTLQYAKGFKDKMIELDHNALFLNFNYTLFLEEHYSVATDRICYIHGCRRLPFGSLVLGHRETDADETFKRWYHMHARRRRYRRNLKDRHGRYFANDKLAYLAYFHDDERDGMHGYRTSARYYAIDPAVSFTEEYFRHNIKQCDDIIDRNRDFFQSLENLKLITVLGHSMSDVDLPYFQEILRHVRHPENIEWQFTCHSDRDVANRNRYCKLLNIRSESNARKPYDISDFKTSRAGIHSHQ